MRIEITGSAHKHGITDDEIRCVIEYSTVVVTIASPVADNGVLYVGRFDDNEPLIEVIGEPVDAGAAFVAFHAMYLTPATVRLAKIEDFIDPADLAHTQRR